MAEKPDLKAMNVVLVHGGFVDGSGWEGVYKILRKDGYEVSIVQNPTISLADDVAATKRIIAVQNGPVILVGHSYGGAVITEAGNDPKVAGLVYITAFAPDKGESVSTLIKNPPPGAPVPPILPPQDGYLFLDKAKFPASFAADVDSERASVHGRLSGSMGRGRAQWHDQRAGLEDQAELVSGCHRRQDDPTGGPTLHVQARGFDCGRGRRQSRDLHVAAERGSRAHRKGRRASEGGVEVSLANEGKATCSGDAWHQTLDASNRFVTAMPSKRLRSTRLYGPSLVS